MWKTYVAVMLGGAVGTGLRFWLATALAARFGDAFPVGTLAVNVLGCFVIGAFSAMFGTWHTPPLTRDFVMAGVLGGFTTFSAFGLQTMNLFTEGAPLRAGLNIVLSVALCLFAVWLGQTAVAAFTER